MKQIYDILYKLPITELFTLSRFISNGRINKPGSLGHGEKLGGPTTNLEAMPQAYLGLKTCYYLVQLYFRSPTNFSKFESTMSRLKTGGSAMKANETNRSPSINGLQSSYTGTLVNPGIRLPDVKDFKVNLSGGDKLLAVVGFLKRMKPTMIYSRYGNASINRYITHQTIRLNKSADNQNYLLFGTIARQILSHSNTFFVAGLHHIDKHGHRNRPLSEIYQVMAEYRSHRSVDFPEIDFKRVYIPKGIKGYRPLGVPTLAGRIYLHNGGNIFAILFKHTILPIAQHGFYPQRGTLTCGKAILGKIFQSESIYSFDLQGCFNNINVFTTITKMYHEYQIPSDLLNKISMLSTSVPKFPNDLKLDESSQFHFGRQFGTFAKSGFPQGNPFSPILTSYALSQSLFKLCKPNELIMYADDGLLFNHTPSEITEIFNSPLLKEYGVILNPSKSFGVKQNNVGMENLKFLGLTYLFNSDELISSVRQLQDHLTTTNSVSWLVLKLRTNDLLRRIAGYSELYSLKLRPFEQTLLHEAYLHDELSDLISETQLTAPEHQFFIRQGINAAREGRGDSQYGGILVPIGETNTRKGEDFIKSKLSGFIQSRLYNQRGDLTELAQDFSYKYSHNSGSGRYNKHFGDGTLTIFNSSSYACRSLLNMMRRQYKYAIHKSARRVASH